VLHYLKIHTIWALHPREAQYCTAHKGASPWNTTGSRSQAQDSPRPSPAFTMKQSPPSSSCLQDPSPSPSPRSKSNLTQGVSEPQRNYLHLRTLIGQHKISIQERRPKHPKINTRNMFTVQINKSLSIKVRFQQPDLHPQPRNVRASALRQCKTCTPFPRALVQIIPTSSFLLWRWNDAFPTGPVMVSVFKDEGLTTAPDG
jgi:hypothetical protein